MDPARWKRIQELFEKALERDPGERRAFLKDACGDDDTLFKEVMSLVEADTGKHSLLDGGAAGAAGLPGAAALAGKTVGPYRIVETIGTGGMGIVCLAERADGQFEHRVALKLVKRGMDSETILKRFTGERQILARLDHPNIARLLDGGLTDDGLPYFTMDYVKGEPIDDYCNTRALSIDERLRLFLTVCEAVQYAHRNLVVHRDLKPSNIFVTEDGDVKLLDFGIAKMLGEADEAASPTLTQTGARVMTPAYASPEQVRGEPVTTATDVYSLGVILYELLSGRRPYGASDSTPQELEQAIRATTPERPSKAATRDKLKRRLAGDLDNICLMTLRKEPERRYGSVDHMADDIRRHLAGRTVSARPDTVSYRLQKFVARNRVAVAVSAAVIVLVASLVVFYTAQLAHERDRARLEADKAEQVSDFLASLFQEADPEQPPMTAREMLERGAARIEGELSDHPEVQAAMMDVISQVYQRLALYEEGKQLAERALDILEGLYGRNHEAVAEIMGHLAEITIDTGDFDTAERLFRDAIAIQRRLLDPDHPDLARNLDEMGYVVMRKGDYDAADSLYRAAYAINRKIYTEEDQALMVTINGLATVLHYKGEYDEAERLFRQNLAVMQRLGDKEEMGIATTLNNIAKLLRDKGDYEAAEALYREALALYRRLLGDEHPYVGTVMHNLGSLLRVLGRYDEAETLCREALAIRRTAHGPGHPDVGISLNELGAIQFAKGDAGDAEKLYNEALALSRKALPATHPQIAVSLIGLGSIHMERGHAGTAEPLLREALRIRRETLSASHWETAAAGSELGACLARTGNFEEAERLLMASYATLKSERGEAGGETLAAVKRIVELYDAWDKGKQAEFYRAILSASSSSR